MGGVAGGPFLFFRDDRDQGLVPCLREDRDGRSIAELVWIDGRRAAGLVRLRDGFPTCGGGRPTATDGRRWMVGRLRGDGEAEEEEALCLVPGGHAGGFTGCPVLSCYVCGNPLLRHGELVFLCFCGQSLVLGLRGVDITRDADARNGCGAALVRERGDPAFVDSVAGAALVRERGDPAFVGSGTGDAKIGRVQDSDACTGSGSGARGDPATGGAISGARARPPPPARGAGLVPVGGDAKIGCVQDSDACTGSVTGDAKIGGAVSGARARTPAHGGGARGDPATRDANIGGSSSSARARHPARGGGARGRGVPGAPGPGGGRARGRATPPPTPEGEGRRSRRSEARALAAYKPPPAEEEETEASLAVQPPERDGANQDAAQVSEKNDDLRNCYNDMVSVFQSVKKLLRDQGNLRADANRRRDWSSVGAGVHSVQTQIDDLFSVYDTLCATVHTLRSQIRTAGGYPVEPPMILAAHPRSIAFKK